MQRTSSELSSGPGIFNITDYGAVPDGKTLNTAAIQRAIDDCHDAGGGTVRCGPGVFATGSLMLKSHVELYLAPGCRILGSTQLDDYPDFTATGFNHQSAPERSRKCLIGAAAAENIAITGPGTIDGSGLAFYGPLPEGQRKHAKPGTPRPRIVMFFQCRNVRVEQITLVDSPCWTCWLMQCETVHFHHVKIYGNRLMRNGDGIDLDACRDVTISDCVIRTEDDCIVLRAIQKLYDAPAICENVTVSNCVLDSGCQGVRVGCPSDAVIRHCTFNNLVIHSTANGIYFDHPAQYVSADRAGTCDTHDIHFSNVTIHCKKTPIRIAVQEGIVLPRLSDLSFTNFRIRSGGPCLIQGNTRMLIENIRLSQIDIQTTGDDAVICRHCRGVRLTDVELSNHPAATPGT